MGHVSRPKIILVVLCFVITSILIYRGAGVNAAHKQTSLLGVLADIKGWRSSELIRLDREITDALHLDEYVNYNFSNGAETVSLYIGYYLTSKKVSAAHSPLVCFPGQGWEISNRSTGELSLYPTLDQKIYFSSMIVEHNKSKQLFIYWFQAYDRANQDTFSQKISILRNKILGKGQDNAFVRISTDLNEMTISEARETIFAFIRSFYPLFLKFIEDGHRTTSAS